jgi:hypothetical protein
MPLSFGARHDRHRADLIATIVAGRCNRIVAGGLIRSPALRALPYVGRLGNLRACRALTPKYKQNETCVAWSGVVPPVYLPEVKQGHAGEEAGMPQKQ